MLERGLRLSAIARHFGVDYHTVDKAIRWYRWRCFVISNQQVSGSSPLAGSRLSPCFPDTYERTPGSASVASARVGCT